MPAALRGAASAAAPASATASRLPDRMSALWKEPGRPGFELVERPVPVVGDGEVLIRVRRTGICGTDLHIERWDDWAAHAVNAPLIPGHEFSGEVVAIGSGVRDVRPGDRCSAEGHVVCGTCRNCRAGRRHMCIRTSNLGVNRDGAFAEYVVLPESNVWVLPVGFDLDLAAVFDPFGNAVHTALSFPLVGEDVLITGAGPIGIMAAAVARHVGARFVVITEVRPERLELARAAGVDLAVQPGAVAEAQRTLGMREGFDVGMEMSGHPAALPEMIENLNHGGRVAMLGLPSAPIDIDWARVISHMITLKGIYGREMYETWYEMSAMLASSAELTASIGRVITDRFDHRDFEKAFATAAAGTGGKVVMAWD